MVSAEDIALPLSKQDIKHRVDAVDDTTKAIVITAGTIARLLFPSFARKLLQDAVPNDTAEHTHV